MTASPLVSVIIPTYNGKHRILRPLRALEQQTFTDFEVLVVIDGSTDGTYAAISTARLGLRRLRIIQQQNLERSAARNRGAKEARGEILVFFDDDVDPIPTCVATHVEHQRRAADLVVVGNQTEDPALLKTDMELYRKSLSDRWTATLTAFDRVIDRRNLFLTGANFSIRRDTFLSLGGFDEGISDVEDFDFAVRAIRAGKHIVIAPEAISWHNDPVTCKWFIRRNRIYRRNIEKHKSTHREMYVEFRPDSLEPPAVWKKALHWPFAQMFWVNVIDQGRWPLLFPKRLRHALYTHVVWGYVTYFPDKDKDVFGA